MEIENSETFGEPVKVKHYGRGFLVETRYCMPQTAEPLVVGVLARKDGLLELTDFSFSTEFVQTSKYDYRGVPEKICEIAKRYNVQWIDEAITCVCEEKDLQRCWRNVVQAMKEVIYLCD